MADIQAAQDQLAALLRWQYNLVTRRQAAAYGLSRNVIEYRTRVGGPWQRLLPGVFLTTTGVPTLEQREVAALLYGGAASVLTGPSALRRQRVSGVRQDLDVDLLVPAACRKLSREFVKVHRTYCMPEKHCVEGPFRWVLPARAVADMARGMSDLAEVRAVVAKVVQGGQCGVSALRLELDSGPMQGSALFRQVLAEVADGIRSVPEGELRDLIKRAGLPSPMFNPRLFAGKRFIACPDCWWAREGVAVEVDSREWHFAPGDWEKTMHRHEVMGAHGIITLHLTPRRIRQDPTGVVSAIKDALAAGQARPALDIRTVPASG
jgi:hypothetical protein